MPHHLIDIREPWEPYSAAAFVQDATPLIAEIRARGALPLLEKLLEKFHPRVLLEKFHPRV